MRAVPGGSPDSNACRSHYSDRADDRFSRCCCQRRCLSTRQYQSSPAIQAEPPENLLPVPSKHRIIWLATINLYSLNGGVYEFYLFPPAQQCTMLVDQSAGRVNLALTMGLHLATGSSLSSDEGGDGSRGIGYGNCSSLSMMLMWHGPVNEQAISLRGQGSLLACGLRCQSIEWSRAAFRKW